MSYIQNIDSYKILVLENYFCVLKKIKPSYLHTAYEIIKTTKTCCLLFVEKYCFWVLTLAIRSLTFEQNYRKTKKIFFSQI